MIAVRFLSRAELERKLSPYRCTKVADVAPCVELWETGWREPFTLSTDNDGRYDEWEYRRILISVVAQTMPANWNGIT
jgi:hypothetical protein